MSESVACKPSNIFRHRPIDKYPEEYYHMNVIVVNVNSTVVKYRLLDPNDYFHWNHTLIVSDFSRDFIFVG